MKHWQANDIKADKIKTTDILEMYKSEIFETRIAVSKIFNDSRFTIPKKDYTSKTKKSDAKLVEN